MTMRRPAQFARVVLLTAAACAMNCTAQEVQQTVPAQNETSPPDAIPQPIRPVRTKVPTGSLSGTVYCADTNLPARGAQILLVNTSDNSSGFQSAGTSDLEGRFAIKSVRQGDYYVMAGLPGYMNLLTSLKKTHVESLPDDERKKIMAQVPSVTISPDQPAQISIRLERGAEIDGTVMYDDGGPAIGLELHYKLKTLGQDTGSRLAEMIDERSYGESQPDKTDDRGHFRILGVPPGEYLVSVSVPTASAELAAKDQVAAMLGEAMGGMDVYVGDGLRASKAESIKVDTGGASKDADITIPLSKLHTIRGQVVLKSTGEPPASAVVQLLYADTKEPARTAIAPDGEFEMRWVPEGSFILRADASADPLPKFAINDDENGFGKVVSSGFAFSMNPAANEVPGGSEVSIAITGDVDHVSITVPDPPANRQGESNADQVLGGPPDGPADNPH